MRLQEKSVSKLTLVDLLRRKRKNLTTHLKEAGIVTYERLVRSCASVGLIPPSEDEFRNALGNPPTPMVSSPTDGILVLDPPEITDISLPVEAEEEAQATPEELQEELQEPIRQKKKKKTVETPPAD